jgi:hypothetical protein
MRRLVAFVGFVVVDAVVVAAVAATTAAGIVSVGRRGRRGAPPDPRTHEEPRPQAVPLPRRLPPIRVTAPPALRAHGNLLRERECEGCTYCKYLDTTYTYNGVEGIAPWENDIACAFRKTR